ncbi:hypothetical protein ABEB36_014929 [Hypothenemus hampei]|uniref:Uncharacterized protein n=1 Tax=Hypothenemus hampei TaxID=57062 RepID=A0ABD1E1L3_HYPHA
MYQVNKIETHLGLISFKTLILQVKEKYKFCKVTPEEVEVCSFETVVYVFIIISCGIASLLEGTLEFPKILDVVSILLVMDSSTYPSATAEDFHPPCFLILRRSAPLLLHHCQQSG